MLKSTVCFSIRRGKVQTNVRNCLCHGGIKDKWRNRPTVLLLVEVLDTVAGLFVVPERGLVFLGIKVGLIVPCLLLFQLQHVDYKNMIRY